MYSAVNTCFAVFYAQCILQINGRFEILWHFEQETTLRNFHSADFQVKIMLL
ncbi:MAG: hypothetical protein AAGC65_21940 [Mucilaginibacter sp.]|uniref:hypothetical protein n=1 Tax=Mucilaginibacter sp. TaxID=1882438 RepID=UPI00319EDA26